MRFTKSVHIVTLAVAAAFVIGTAGCQSDEEKLAVYRFRYDIYVKEMGRYGKAADDDRRLLIETEDETARIFYAAEAGEVVATSRFSWGGDAPFSERLIDHYQLAPFLEEVPPEAMAVGERGMVIPRLRGSDVFFRLGQESSAFIEEKRIQLIFGACEPHLLSLYIGNGQRTYSERNINSAESGYLIPLVTVNEDIEYFRRIGARQVDSIKDRGDDARIPACVDRLITGSGSVISQRLTAANAYFGTVQDALNVIGDTQISPLNGLSEEDVIRCLGRSRHS